MSARRFFLGTAAALAFVLPATHGAQAATLVADGGWAGFTVDGNLPPYSLAWTADDDGSAGFDFSVVTIAAGFQLKLTVVDLGFSGDRYTVYDNGALLGTTGPAVNGDTSGAIEFSADNALANSSFSRGVFTLGAGSHSITGVMSTSLQGLDASIGAVKLEVSPVPEPATVASLLAGLALLGAVTRRRSAR